MTTFTRAESNRTMTTLRCFKKHFVKFWNPTAKLLIECIKSLRELIAKTIKNSCQISTRLG